MPIRPTLLIALGLLSGLTPFAIDLYLPSLPAIARDLGSSIELAQLSVTVYLGVFALAQLFLGPLSDVLGRRKTIGGGLFLFLVAGLACMLAPSMDVLLAARAVQALGGAAVAVTVPALVRDLYEKDDYARIMGLVMLVMAMAPLIAPTLGSLIIGVASWRVVFLFLFAIALTTTVLFFRTVGETLHARHRHSFDPGQILRNYRRVIRHPLAMGYLLTGAASFAGMMTFIVSSPYVYIELHHLPATWFGLAFGSNVALGMLFSSLNARYVKRLGADRLLRLGILTQVTAAVIALSLALLGDTPLWAIAAVAALYLSMTGLVIGNSMAGFMAFFPKMAGTASAFAGAIRFGSGAAMGTLVSLVHDGSAAPLLIGMGASGLLAFAAFGIACRGFRTNRTPTKNGRVES
ncbi:Bcr/CflA family multidrug efflux MFS transporter [Thiorhodococcus mannitoliphagus]|uniref:Bcr/CflA family efflux transporter n=1 Tax=Thiorhodococcus mannitoliphagus TaxID=329406 RepID=A0A6P1DPC6_9GAMM|nr:Bcr/CflA family multidrug efflux MFS transporter [Thiorhodococcus mannitoliphagus]NEX19003.1 Bcr/CflA family multidrug efflux MFS transporter [Thiorhodococcus mannitoliphagus]